MIRDPPRSISAWATLPSGKRQAEDLDGAKRLLVELDGRSGVRDGEVGRDGVIAIGDRLDRHRISVVAGRFGTLMALPDPWRE